MKPEKLNQQLKELFGKLPDNFSMLDQKIDIDLQMQYFEESVKIKKEDIPEDILEDNTILYDNEVDLSLRKRMLIQIAGVEEPEAFRILEKFVEVAEGELYSWGIMALQESKMLLESLYLDQPQVFISTGLGGKEQLLRYFSVFFKIDDKAIDAIQEKVIRNELDTYLKKVSGELESATIDHNIFKMMTLLPISIDITSFFYDVLKECNQYGDFLYEKCLITNVKELERNEIDTFLKKKRDDDKNYNMLNENL